MYDVIRIVAECHDTLGRAMLGVCYKAPVLSTGDIFNKDIIRESVMASAPPSSTARTGGSGGDATNEKQGRATTSEKRETRARWLGITRWKLRKCWRGLRGLWASCWIWVLFLNVMLRPKPTSFVGGISNRHYQEVHSRGNERGRGCSKWGGIECGYLDAVRLGEGARPAENVLGNLLSASPSAPY